MAVENNTPILVGVAEVVEPLTENLSEASSAQALAGKAAVLALQDALDVERLAPEIDVVAATRTFPDSTPMWPMPFGRSNNMPRSIAQRIGASPQQAIYCTVGGNTPQQLVNEWSEKLAAGAASMVLLAGAEVIASTKAAMRTQTPLDWAETVDGELEDKGLGMEGMLSFEQMRHQLMMAPASYALCEMARRAKQGKGLASYGREMAEQLAPFSQVAANNPNAMFQQSYTAEEIATPTEKNGYVAFPYTKAMVAKDGVNQAAAVLMTTVGKAKELGIDESKWVYLHAYADTVEQPLLEREDLGESKALTLAYQQVLKQTGISGEQLEVMDVYSCFPIVVAEAQVALGLEKSDKLLTQTGGLPFFGGPGNNYSMHGIASVVRGLRGAPKSYGLVGANGGVMHKHSVGVYSCMPGWQKCDSSGLQAQLDERTAVEICSDPQGDAIIESYTVQFARGMPLFAIVIGRLEKNGERFIANNFENDRELLESLLTKDMVGQRIVVDSIGRGNRVTLSKESMLAHLPPKVTSLRNDYEFCSAKRQGHVLEVTINRPEALNSLHPFAHEELAEIFDVFDQDEKLWVAIISGAGDKAFCTGNDLKYSASGKPQWIPKSGFAGLTRRRRNKPVIAAVNGFAMGGGMEIALACDIIIAAEHAVFGLPEVKVGLIAGAGGIQRLARQIPLKQAMDLLISGKQISAEKAEALGFVNQVVVGGGVMDAAREYAQLLCQNSPTSIRLTMELLAETSVHSSLDDAVSGMPKTIDKLLTSEDFMEGPKAFAQKRKPKWSGR